MEIFAGARGRVALGLLVVEFTAATQSLVVTTVMPKIASDLHGLALYGFAYAALFGASLVAMAFAGPVADRYGTWRVLGVAYVLAFAGLLGSMLSPTMPLFVAARALEGFGGGLDYVVSVAAIAKLYPENLRPRVFAWISAMWIVPGLLGPGLGALIAATFGWRYVFALFIPLVVLSAILVLPALRGMTPVAREGDPLGAIRILFSREILLLKDPRSFAIAAFVALQAAFFGADAYVSLMLTGLRGLSLASAGICITLAVVGWTIGSTIQPRLLSRIGTRGLVVTGAVLGLCALTLMLAVVLGAPVAVAFIGWSIGGTGIGLSFATLQLASIAGWPEGSEGTVSSATLLAGTLGSTIGILLCGLPITIAHNYAAPLSLAMVWTFSIAVVLALSLLALALKIEERVV